MIRRPPRSTRKESRQRQMCIRDRAAVEYDATNRVVWCAYPVSYTHLRAHETLSDLVCRLLLEKKPSRRR
ncbi:hypothetical protein [Staphylococcus aureus]